MRAWYSVSPAAPKKNTPMNAIRRSELVQQAIVRRPVHPRRLVGVLVIGRVAAKPQAQLASAPRPASLGCSRQL
jgi:hypothetical protein